MKLSRYIYIYIEITGLMHYVGIVTLENYGLLLLNMCIWGIKHQFNGLLIGFFFWFGV